MPQSHLTTVIADNASLVEVGSGVLSEPSAGCWDKSDSWKAVRDRMSAISALGPDWDGMGGDAPSAALVESLVRYVQFLCERNEPPPLRIAPTALGTIILEWQSPGTYVEAELVSPGLLEIMEVRDGEPARHSVSHY